MLDEPAFRTTIASAIVPSSVNRRFDGLSMATFATSLRPRTKRVELSAESKVRPAEAIQVVEVEASRRARWDGFFRMLVALRADRSPKAVRLRLEIEQSPCHSSGCATAWCKRGLQKDDGSKSISGQRRRQTRQRVDACSSSFPLAVSGDLVNAGTVGTGVANRR